MPLPPAAPGPASISGSLDDASSGEEDVGQLQSTYPAFGVGAPRGASEVHLRRLDCERFLHTRTVAVISIDAPAEEVCCGHCVVDTVLWTLCCGHCVVDTVLWTLCCGHSVVDTLLWTLCCGHSLAIMHALLLRTLSCHACALLSCTLSCCVHMWWWDSFSRVFPHHERHLFTHQACKHNRTWICIIRKCIAYAVCIANAVYSCKLV